MIYTEYGKPEVLHLAELDKPIPKDNEVLIKVHAVEATKSDCELRSFKFPVNWFRLPLRIAVGWFKPRRQVLGGYFAGEIEAVGKEVTEYQIGEKIFGTANLNMGTYAEYACLPAKNTMVAKPENMSFIEAAAVPLGGLNALHFMRKADIKPGEKVLINGAGGSIGSFGLQIAKTMGAEITAVDSQIKKEMLLELGADQFIDYNEQVFTESNEKYDVIFDMVARSSFSACLGALKNNGRYVTANPTLTKMLGSFFVNKFSNKKSIFAFAGEKEEELVALKELIEAGQIRSVVDKVYPLEQAAEAHRRVETEQRIGIVAIAVVGEA